MVQSHIVAQTCSMSSFVGALQVTLLRTILVLTAALSLSLSTTTSAQNCQPEWDTGFAQEGADRVSSLALFDDGSGMALYVSGPEMQEMIVRA